MFSLLNLQVRGLRPAELFCVKLWREDALVVVWSLGFELSIVVKVSFFYMLFYSCCSSGSSVFKVEMKPRVYGCLVRRVLIMLVRGLKQLVRRDEAMLLGEE